MMRAVYPGSFDPFTLGHLDIIQRASKLFEKVYVAVAEDTDKSCIATLEQREAMARECVKFLKNVEVLAFNGMTTDFAIKNACRVIVRGIRGASDVEYEKNLSRAYKSLGGLETISFFSETEHISSSLVRELSKSHGDLTGYVCPEILEKVNKIYSEE